MKEPIGPAICRRRGKLKVAGKDDPEMKILRGIMAVLAGFIFVLVSHTATDLVLERLGIFTPPEQGFHIVWMILTALAYRTIWTFVASYFTAWLAPEPKMRWVVILGILGLLGGIAGIFVNLKMKFGPIGTRSR
jgi:hypothetical protein